MPDQTNNPISYDPHNRRWTRFKAAAIVIVIAVVVIFTVMTLSVVSTPPLPDLNLASTRTSFQASHVSSPDTPTPQGTPAATANSTPSYQNSIARLRGASHRIRRRSDCADRSA